MDNVTVSSRGLSVYEGGHIRFDPKGFNGHDVVMYSNMLTIETFHFDVDLMDMGKSGDLRNMCIRSYLDFFPISFFTF